MKKKPKPAKKVSKINQKKLKGGVEVPVEEDARGLGAATGIRIRGN